METPKISIKLKIPQIASKKVPISFKPHISSPSKVTVEETLPQGFFYYPNFISADESAHLTDYLNTSESWVGVTSAKTSRRVIHYGYKYPYSGGSSLEITDPIPTVFDTVIKRFKVIGSNITNIGSNSGDIGSNSGDIDQLIINEYLPSQGIAPHIDDPKKFGSIIYCLTLGSGIEIKFTCGTQTKYVYVEPNSLYVMSGPARSQWKHEIVKRKNDVYKGQTIARGVRRSVTARTVL
jgi:alkylated DNA repair dioxygenase AlkB